MSDGSEGTSHGSGQWRTQKSDGISTFSGSIEQLPTPSTPSQSTRLISSPSLHAKRNCPSNKLLFHCGQSIKSNSSSVGLLMYTKIESGKAEMKTSPYGFLINVEIPCPGWSTSSPFSRRIWCSCSKHQHKWTEKPEKVVPWRRKVFEHNKSLLRRSLFHLFMNSCRNFYARIGTNTTAGAPR